MEIFIVVELHSEEEHGVKGVFDNDLSAMRLEHYFQHSNPDKQYKVIVKHLGTAEMD